MTIPMRKLLAIFLIPCLLFALQAVHAEDEHPCNDCHEVDVALFESTPHGSTECLDCHVRAERRHRRGLDPVECGECHAEVLAVQSVSAHGRSDLHSTPGIELPWRRAAGTTGRSHDPSH